MIKGKMTNKPSYDLASEMKLNMRPKLPTPEEKLVIALNHLNSAAEAFDEADNSKFAQLVTDAITKLSE
jgi:hypothetical protein